MKKYILLSICCIIIFNSCANTLDIIHYKISGPPSWVGNPNPNNDDEFIFFSAGPCETYDDSRNMAYNEYSNNIICKLTSVEEISNIVSSDNKSREVSTYLKTNQKSSSAVTLKGLFEIDRWQNPITKEVYIYYKMARNDFEKSQKATEDKIKELIRVDSNLIQSILTLDKTIEPSFIKNFYNAIDLYHSIKNREWEEPLYVDFDSHIVLAEIYLSQYITRSLSSISIQLINDNLECEDLEEKELRFKIISDKYDDFSQVKLILENTALNKTYLSNLNVNGEFSFIIPSNDLDIGINQFKCYFFALDIPDDITSAHSPIKNLELNVIHTPKTPSGLTIHLSNPPWSSVYLNWNKVDDASQYYIYRKEVASNNSEYFRVDKTKNNYYEDRNLSDNHRYIYRVNSLDKLSNTESKDSIANTIKTRMKPKLELTVSKQSAVGCEEIYFYWNDIEDFRNTDSKFTIQLIKDDIVKYSISNVPNLFKYSWIVPFNIKEGNYFVQIIEENTKLSNSKMPSIYLSGKHLHDGNRNEKIGILETNDTYDNIGWVCNQELLDQYQLQVNSFLFKHAFSINIQPLNNKTDIALKIVDLESSKTELYIDDNKNGIAETKSISLKKGVYSIQVIYLSGEGGKYSVHCERLP